MNNGVQTFLRFVFDVQIQIFATYVTLPFYNIKNNVQGVPEIAVQLAKE